MKQLIRRLSRVANSSQYCLLRSDSSSSSASAATSASSRRVLKLRRRKISSESVRKGHVPVYAGEEMERFVVSAELLNHPVFVELLNKSAQEYGYEQRGVLRIPCHVVVFERVLEALRHGLAAPSSDVSEILGYSAVEDPRHGCVVYAN